MRVRVMTWASVCSNRTMVTFFGWLSRGWLVIRVIGSLETQRVMLPCRGVTFTFWFIELINSRTGAVCHAKLLSQLLSQFSLAGSCRENLEWFSAAIVMFQGFLIVSLSVSCSPASVSDSSAIKHSSDVDWVGWSDINWNLAMHVTRQGHKQNGNYNNGELSEVC